MSLFSSFDNSCLFQTTLKSKKRLQDFLSFLFDERSWHFQSHTGSWSAQFCRQSCYRSFPLAFSYYCCIWKNCNGIGPRQRPTSNTFETEDTLSHHIYFGKSLRWDGHLSRPWSSVVRTCSLFDIGRLWYMLCSTFCRKNKRILCPWNGCWLTLCQDSWCLVLDRRILLVDKLRWSNHLRLEPPLTWTPSLRIRAPFWFCCV